MFSVFPRGQPVTQLFPATVRAGDEPAAEPGFTLSCPAPGFAATGYNSTVETAQIAVLLFGGRGLPHRLADLPSVRIDDAADIDAALTGHRRVVVVGADTDLAAVLTRLLRTESFDVEVGYVPRRRTAATRAYRLPAGRRALSRAVCGPAQRVPLIRDDTGTVLVGAAAWLPADTGSLHGEAVVDDAVLFDGDAAGVRIEPTATMPGLRARMLAGRGRWRWQPGRAAQLGTTGAAVVIDGSPGRRPVKRATLYRHVRGWLAVR